MPFASKSCFVPLAGKGAGLSRPHALGRGHEKHFPPPQLQMLHPLQLRRVERCSLQRQNCCRFEVAITRPLEIYSCHHKNTAKL